MNDEQRAELKRLAEAATKGCWVADGDKVRSPNEEVPYPDGSRPSVATAWSHTSTFRHDAGRLSLTSGTAEANARFIAAANPAVVLDLLAENERLKAEIQQMKGDARDAAWERDLAD